LCVESTSLASSTLKDLSDPTSATDRELVERANCGDARAFELLYERYREWIVAVAYRTVGDRDIALDSLQDTIAYWLTKFPGFVLLGQVKSFLYPVVRHLAIDAARKRRRSGELPSEFDRAADCSSSVGDASSLHAALERLPARQREVLLLHFW